MTPSLTECIPDQLSFGRVKGRKVIANFKGGTLTSDGGLILVAQLDKKRQITTRFASCFTDYRRQGYVEHSAGIIHSTREISKSILWERNRSALVRESYPF